MELIVGDKRDFSFDDRKFIIREIIDEPNFQMIWTWDTGVCPHCKKKLSNRINHSFRRIEILQPEFESIDNATRDTIIVLGDTKDGKKMMITKEKYNEVLTMSKIFSHLVTQE